MKITYLFHSGFMVELDNNLFIFDYFKDNCKKNRYRDCGQLKPEDMPKDKNVYIFVSHGHYDHYDKEILTFNADNVNYIFYKEIRVKNEQDNIYYMNPYETLIIDDINIKTYGSTDEGISFLISAESKTIFNAGDLNWWHWEGETPDEKEYAKKAFLSEIEKITENNIDIAFFPVDPRLENAYYMGGEYFIEKIKPKIFIPMHFQDVYDVTDKFKKHMSNKTGIEILTIHERGEIIYKD